MREYGYQEGDLELAAAVSPAPPLAIGAAAAAAAPAAQFAEPTQSPPTAIDDLASQLATAAAAPWGELIAALGDLVAAAPDLPRRCRSACWPPMAGSIRVACARSWPRPSSPPSCAASPTCATRPGNALFRGDAGGVQYAVRRADCLFQGQAESADRAWTTSRRARTIGGSSSPAPRRRICSATCTEPSPSV